MISGTRSITFAFIPAVTALTLAMTSAPGFPARDRSTPTPTSGPEGNWHRSHPHVAAAAPLRMRSAPPHSFALSWAPMAPLAPLAPEHRAFLPHKAAGNRPLFWPAFKLSLPAPQALALTLPTTPVADTHAVAAANLRAAPLMMNPHAGASTVLPVAQDAKLFNQYNGLRGFMAHNWLNPHVGLQGGLAIRDSRLRPDGRPLTSSMAVGMGVLLAF